VVLRRLLATCGIPSQKLTQKAWRNHNVSFWASIGLALKVRMRMCGHKKPESQAAYDRPADFEIKRAGEITWKYFQAIRDGKEFFIPTTPRCAMSADLKWSFENLEKVMHAAFREQREFLVSEFGEVKRELVEIKCELRLLRGDLMQLDLRSKP
jgi:hypothetical protein